MIVLTRGGGSFEDLLPFSDERLVRAVAGCRVPIVSAVGHEQDTPLCDLAADVRASTPTMAGKLVVPELAELSGTLDRARESLARCARRTLERDAQRLERSAERLRAAPRRALEKESERVERAHERLRRAPALMVERKRAVLAGTAERFARAPALMVERKRAALEGTAGKTRCVVTEGNTQARVRDRPDGLARPRERGRRRARSARRGRARRGRVRRARRGRQP